MTGYALHPEAQLDLDEIHEYVAEDSQDSADRVIDASLTTMERLADTPHPGHRRPDLTARHLRFSVIWQYLIAYAPDEYPVWVVAVLHRRRHPGLLAAILNERR